MGISKRQLLCFLVGASAIASLPAAADQFPNKPVKLVVGFAAGGLTDQIARNLGQQLSTRWGQQVIVENRAGGNLVPATQYFTTQAPDGYTIHVGNSQPFTVNVAYFKSLPYGAHDYTPVGLLTEIPMALYVPANSPFKTLRELVDYAKKNPGKLNYGSPGQLSQGALGMEAFKTAAGIDVVSVPYQGGGPAVVAMLGGQVDMMFADLATALPHVKAGKVRVLVTNQSKRLAPIPDVPGFAEAGFPNVDIPPIWYGVFAPPKTPRALVDKLNADMAIAMKTPEMAQFLETTTMLPRLSTPEEMEALIKNDVAFYGPLLKRLGLKSD